MNPPLKNVFLLTLIGINQMSSFKLMLRIFLTALRPLMCLAPKLAKMALILVWQVFRPRALRNFPYQLLAFFWVVQHNLLEPMRYDRLSTSFVQIGYYTPNLSE